MEEVNQWRRISIGLLSRVCGWRGRRSWCLGKRPEGSGLELVSPGGRRWDVRLNFTGVWARPVPTDDVEVVPTEKEGG